MKRALGLIIVISFLSVSCQRDLTAPTSPVVRNPAPATLPQGAAIQTSGSMNGVGGSMPAYYDGTLFKINFMELPPGGETANIAANVSINTIYQSDPGLPGGEMFISVLDAIQGDGFNPLWREVQITFNGGFTPRQLFSDTEILAAAAGSNPEITLTTTDELYRCSVIGH
jgi:hypothetical protein